MWSVIGLGWSNDEDSFGIDDLRSIGIKEYLLDLSKTKKMDDNLPLLLFPQENIEKEIIPKKYNILLAKFDIIYKII